MSISLQSFYSNEICDDILWSVSWSPLSDDLVCTGSDHKIYHVSFKKESSALIKKVIETEHKRTIRSVNWSPCGQYLAAACFDSTVTIYYVDSDNVFNYIGKVEGHESEVKCVAWDSCSSFLATCGRDCSVWVWEFLAPDEFHCVSVTNNHTQDVKHVAFQPNSKLLTSVGYDGLVNFYDMDEETEWFSINKFRTMTETFSQGSETIWSCSYSPDGVYLDDQFITIYLTQYIRTFSDIVKGNFPSPESVVACRIKSPQNLAILDISWSFDGRFLAACSRDNTVAIFELFTGSSVSLKHVLSLTDSDCDINSVAWKRTSDYTLAYVTDSGKLFLYQFNVV